MWLLFCGNLTSKFGKSVVIVLPLNFSSFEVKNEIECFKGLRPGEMKANVASLFISFTRRNCCYMCYISKVTEVCWTGGNNS